MRRILSFTDDPEINEARAQEAIDEIRDIVSQPAWHRLMGYLSSSEMDCIESLVATDSHSERVRGRIDSIRMVMKWSQDLRREATNELNKHRGE